MSLTWIGSPNYTKGRDGQKVSGIVIHWMAGTLAATDAVFQDKTRQTSAHYGVEETNIHQYVSEADTAYHAGKWGVNLTTIGIEHSAQPGRDASNATYQNSAALIAQICQRYALPINANTIIPHHSIVATQCPGTIDLSKLIAMAQAVAQGGNMPASQTIVDALTIQLLYNIGLSRQPSDTEVASWAGKTVEQLARTILTSAELKQIQTDRAYGIRARAENWEATIADAGTELKPGKYIVR